MSRLADPAHRGQVAKSSFYLGMRALPATEREAMYAVYAFCRDVDDIADDETRPPPARMADLDAWEHDLARLYSGHDPGRAAYLADPARRFGLAHADFAEVVAGMKMDVAAPIVAPDMATLDLYCDRVASAVGRLSVRVFGMEPDPGHALAHHLGRALQLTNILRDIDEDAAIGRLYLARETLDAAGIAPTPAAVTASPGLDAAARPHATRAAEHFTQARRILAARPRGHLIAPRLMERGYADVLARMTAAGWAPPRRRVRVRKARLLLTFLQLQLA